MSDLVDSLLVSSIAAHFLKDNQSARLDEVHPVGTVALKWS